MASRPTAPLASPEQIQSSRSCARIRRAARAGQESGPTFPTQSPESSARRTPRIAASCRRVPDSPLPLRPRSAAPAPFHKLGTNPARSAQFPDASGTCTPPASRPRPASPAPAPSRISGKRRDGPDELRDPSGRCTRWSAPSAAPGAIQKHAGFLARQLAFPPRPKERWRQKCS